MRIAKVIACVCLCLCLVGGITGPRSALAQTIDPREINLLAGSWTVDAEIAVLNGMYGSDPNSVVCYGATVTPTGWTGVSAGTWLGNEISVNYEGVYTITSPTTATISVTSVGTYGDKAWSGSGTWDWVDPNVSGSIGNTMSVSIGGQIGYVSLSASVSKDLVRKQLSASVTAGTLSVPLLGAAVEVGADFTLDQSTGKDDSSLKAKILWGLVTMTRTVDKTQLFTPPPPAIPVIPPPPPTPPTPPFDYPYIPPGGGSGGFDPNDPNAPGTEYMYVGVDNLPEPATLSLLALGGLALLRRRNRGR